MIRKNERANVYTGEYSDTLNSIMSPIWQAVTSMLEITDRML